MLLSMKWLSDFIDIKFAPAPGGMTLRDFSEAMTMSGSKVESYETEGSQISKVVVGKILSVEKHPNADKLVICKVDVGGEEPLQIVTGAKNVFAGALVPVALDGSSLPGGVKIKKGKLRGVDSVGMMCSLKELGLTLNDFPYAIENGIFIIEEDCRPGEDIHKAIGLDDAVVDFEITPNRPDCLSVRGLALEAAATFGQKMKHHVPQVKSYPGKTTDFIKVKISDPSLCRRYSARAVKNVKIAPSPRWMRERLRAQGVRPINNIVDITNYVMLEYGQPMHAFDYRTMAGGAIDVRRARKGESIVTLDGVKRALTEDMLVIADAEKPAAVAGVMGGENSGIADDTNTIVFESANFDGTSIRLTSRKLGLRSEASSRYEKGLDPQMTMDALSRACELVCLLGAGEPVGDSIDIDNTDKALRKIPLDPKWTNRFLGTDIDAETMKNALRSLEFTVEDGMVTVPSCRGDVEHKADIAEEIARMYGYNKIPVSVDLGVTLRGGLNAAQKFEKHTGETLRALGLTQVITYSFISPKCYDRIRLPENDPHRKCVKIRNPLGEDTSVMRTTLLPSMLEVLARNYSNRNLEAAFYELGTVYIPKGEDDLPDENRKIAVGMYGAKVDFFTLKGAVEELLEKAGVREYDVAVVTDDPTFHPGRCAKFTSGGKTLAVLGEAHPQVQENYGIGSSVYLAQIDFALLYELSVSDKTYRPLPKFPATTRDLAVVCDEETPVLTLQKTIASAVGRVAETVELFDVYHGEQVPQGKKSVAFTVNMRAGDRTLTDDEADAAMRRAVKALAGIGAQLRA